MKRKLFIFITLLSLCIIVLSLFTACEDPGAGKKKARVLFIGNSYTYYNDMPAIFKEVATSAGASVTVTSITTGSQNLSTWANPATEDGARVEEALTARDDYDIIVLQEQSFRPLSNYSGFLSGARTLAERINETQADCKIILYQPWGSPARADEYGGSIPEMESRLRTAYETVAAEIGATVSYVGKAFTYVYDAFDLETCGKQSDMWLYQDDGTHPLYLGSYLAACVHTATLLQLDPRISSFYGELDAEIAQMMREVAYHIVFET